MRTGGFVLLLAALGSFADAAEVCPRNPAQGPRALIFEVAQSGTDLDEGFTGSFHNFAFANGVTLTYCLSGCNRTLNPHCTAQGRTGPDSLNGPTFGAPVPLVAAGVPLCVTNTLAGPDLHATFNVATGEFEGTVRLRSRTFLSTPGRVCPRCETEFGNFGDTGHCDSGANRDLPCRLDGFQFVDEAAGDKSYPLSSQCPPDPVTFQLTADFEISLNLTTLRASLTNPCPGQPTADICGPGGQCMSDGCTFPPHGGIQEFCCQGGERSGLPCFPATIVRLGSPAVATPPWPDTRYPKTGGGVLVGAFCLPADLSNTVTTSVGVPGPAAVMLPVTLALLGPLCGDGIAELGEECDRGEQNGAPGSCCSADCTLRPASFLCRPAVTACDLAEECNGELDVCPPDRFAPPGTGCVDGNPCTLEDMCIESRCVPGATVCDARVFGQARSPRRLPTVVVECSGQPLAGEQASCEAAGFVNANATGLIVDQNQRPLRPALAPRCPTVSGACTPNQAGQFQVTDSKAERLARRSRTRRLTSPSTVSLRLKLNACGRQLLRQLKAGESLPVEVPVSLRGIKTDNPSLKDVMLERVVELAGRGCR